jgi:uncharacterized RDD family membrane protein YckC
MLPETSTFFVRGDDGREYGPVPLDELREWVQENRAGLGTEVRRDIDGGDWQPWQNFPELVAIVAEVRAMSGPAGVQVVAPMGRRVVAFGLDYVLASILAFPFVYLVGLRAAIPDLEQQFLFALLQPDQPVDPAVMYYGTLGSVITQVAFVLYFTLFHAARGQTPGKVLFKLRVVDQFGNKPYFVKSLLRSLAMIFSTTLLFLPLAYAFFNPHRRALHDFIAGTFVVEA